MAVCERLYFAIIFARFVQERRRRPVRVAHILVGRRFWINRNGIRDLSELVAGLFDMIGRIRRFVQLLAEAVVEYFQIGYHRLLVAAVAMC